MSRDDERRAGFQQFGERLSAVEARQQRAMEDIGELKADVKAILGVLNQARGGWRAYVAIGALAAAVSALVAKSWPFLAVK